MAIPSYLNTTYNSQVVNITGGVTEFLALLDDWFGDNGWTVNGGYLYSSPADAAGRSMKLRFADNGSGILSFKVQNSAGTELVWRGAGVSGPRRLTMWIGPYHFACDFCTDRWAMGEAVCAGILDQYPFAQSSNTAWCIWGFGSRRTVDWTQYQNWWRYIGMRDYYYSVLTATNWKPRCAEADNGGNVCVNQTYNGFPIHHPLEIYASINASENMRWAGRAFQFMLLPDWMFERNNDVIIRVGPDPTDLATFRCVSGMCRDKGMAVGCRVG